MELVKEQSMKLKKVRFSGISLKTLRVSLLGKLLTGKGVMKALKRYNMNKNF